MVSLSSWFLEIIQYSWETPVSLFNKAAGLQSPTLLKRHSGTGVLQP